MLGPVARAALGVALAALVVSGAGERRGARGPRGASAGLRPVHPPCLPLSPAPPYPHLAAAALVLLCAKSHASLAGASLLAALAAGGLHSRGMRVALRPDAAGRLALALVRHGAPVPGLGPGTLLAASRDLDRAGLFARAVVLVTEHSTAGGAKGVLLTRPLADGAAGAPPALLARAAAGGAAMRHFVGGPVGVPGVGRGGGAADPTLLHGVAAVPGARALLPRGWSPGAADADALPDAGVLLFEGGSLADAVRGAAAAATRAPPPPAPPRGLAALGRLRRRPPPSPLRPIVHVYHGRVVWAPAQLEGEVRSGAWGYGAARAGDVLATPPDGLWRALTASGGNGTLGRLRWLGRGKGGRP